MTLWLIVFTASFFCTVAFLGLLAWLAEPIDVDHGDSADLVDHRFDAYDRLIDEDYDCDPAEADTAEFDVPAELLPLDDYRREWRDRGRETND